MSNHTTDRTCPFCNTRPLLPRSNAATCGAEECTAKRIKASNDRTNAEAKQKRREAKEKERAEIERRRLAPYNEKYRAVYAAAAERASLRRADRGTTRPTSGSELCPYCGSRPLRGPKSVTCGDRECMRLRRVARGDSKMKPGDVVVAVRLFSCKECGKVRIPNCMAKNPRYCSMQCLGKSKRKETYREHKYRPWTRLAPRVYERDKYTCWLCGLPTSGKFHNRDPLSPTVDHVVPRSKGGHPTDLGNLRCAHFACNAWRNDRESVTHTDIEKLLLTWGS